MENFADRLTAAVRRTRTPVLVGLDPRWEQLPDSLRSGDDSLASRARAYTRFCQGVIDVVAPLVPAVKPQAAFFEELGPAGMQSLAEVLVYARQKKLLVILDAKRNDIGSTATAYAHGYLDAGGAAAWGADALTVSPYLGDDSLTPFVDVAMERGCGLFTLVKTSNAGGKTFQDLLVDGQPLYRHVGQFVERLAEQTVGACGYGAVGAVVGATYPEQLAELRQAFPRTWFLVPGYGAQGGGAQDVAGAFDAHGLGAIVNNSRGIIFAHAGKAFAQFGPARWQEAVAAATGQMIEELRAETTAGRLAG
ncbi:MAG TPA: orotidine-5'-phosphate decarboxylase [Pirellulales bacterium]|jgi:orotidine-5'-phosphate decarboxylase|nr:orotidine-5'-phosphate decarboxylase [Pirellulales bacterium]